MCWTASPAFPNRATVSGDAFAEYQVWNDSKACSVSFNDVRASTEIDKGGGSSRGATSSVPASPSPKKSPVVQIVSSKMEMSSDKSKTPSDD